MIYLIAALSLAAILLTVSIFQGVRNDDRNYQQAHAPRSADTGERDSAIQGSCCDMHVAAYARLVEDAKRGR